MKSAIAAIGCLLAATGCGLSDRVHVAPAFDDADFALMRTEADILCTATDGEKCLELTRGDASNVARLSTPGELDPGVGANTMVHATAFDIAFLDHSNELHRLSRHEFGHALGCHRELPAGNVMAPYVDQQPETWTDLDLDCILEGWTGD